MECGKKKCDGWGEHHPDNCIVGDKYTVTTCSQFKPLKGNKAPVAKSPAAMAGSAAKAEGLKKKISEILMDALGGYVKKYRTSDGFVRWGVVEGDIHEIIDSALR